jgi:hypothetical protein
MLLKVAILTLTYKATILKQQSQQYGFAVLRQKKLIGK